MLKNIAIGLLILRVMVGAVVGEVQKQQPPQPGTVRPFSFPKFHTKKLANGLTVFVIEDHRQPLVSYNLLVNAGAVRHSPERAGLASMTAQLLRQGTETRSAQDIARAIDNVGGSLSTSADDDTAALQATVMKSSADLGIELLADVLLRPVFKQEEIERLLRQTLSGLQIQYTDPEYLAPASAARVIFGTHPYAYPVEGTPDTLPAIKRDDIVEFHRRSYTPVGAFLAISGDLMPEEAFARAEKHLAAWAAPTSTAAAPPAPPSSARSVLIVDKPDAVQTQIVVGKLGIRRNDPDYFALLIGNQIFGGSFNSRLNMKLRAQEGLTYGARSSFDSEREAGSFRVSTFTRTEETAKAIAMLLDLLKEFRQNPGTQAEIDEAKAYLVGSFAIGSETPGQVAARVLTAAKYGLPVDYWDKYRENVQAVTFEELAAAVNRHIDPDKMIVVAVGNSKDFAKQLETHGPARTIHFSDLDLIRPDLNRPKGVPPAASPESAARGLEWVRSAAEAVGGAEALDRVSDIVVKASINVSAPQGEMNGDGTIEVLYPDKLKMTLTLPFGQMMQGFDGKAGWMVFGPQKMDLPASMNSEMTQSVQRSLGIGVLREALARRAQVQALEPSELDGKKMDTVLWKQGDSTVTLLLDPSTHLIARLSYRSVSLQGAAEVNDVWSDYREASGLKVPFKLISYRNGQKFTETSIKEIQFNTGLDPNSFSKPE